MPARPDHLDARGHWLGTLLVASVLTTLYALLITPLWSPGGDSELYACLARSLARGDGYTYNGEVVRLLPPGWPIVLAGVFKLSPTFLAGKLVNLLCMVGFAALAHRVLLRFVTNRLAVFATIVGGMLGMAYPLTMWLHTDALFCLLAWASVLTAMRAVEADAPRARWLWLSTTFLLSILLLSVRFAAVFQWALVATLLLAGFAGNVSRRRLLILVGSIGGGLVLLAGMFVATLLLIGHYGESAEPVSDLSSSAADSEHALPNVIDNGQRKGRPYVVDRLLRLANAGQWAAWTLWYPSRFASGIGPIGHVVNVVGWFALAWLVVAAWKQRAQLSGWLWLATLGYVLAYAVLWPLPNARYLTPIGPLLLTGVLVGVRSIHRPTLRKWLSVSFVATLVGFNALLYAIDVSVARSGDYYATYEAGRTVSLLDATAYLRDQGIEDGDVIVSERYDNLGKNRYVRSSTREAVLLLDRDVIPAPDRYSIEPIDPTGDLFAHPEAEAVKPDFWKWATQEQGATWYLYQRRVEPWRLWHFRLTDSLHARLDDRERMFNVPATGEADGWVLYRLGDGKAKRIDVPASDYRLRRVPGM